MSEQDLAMENNKGLEFTNIFTFNIITRHLFWSILTQSTLVWQLT